MQDWDALVQFLDSNVQFSHWRSRKRSRLDGLTMYQEMHKRLKSYFQSYKDIVDTHMSIYNHYSVDTWILSYLFFSLSVSTFEYVDVNYVLRLWDDKFKRIHPNRCIIWLYGTLYTSHVHSYALTRRSFHSLSPSKSLNQKIQRMITTSFFQNCGIVML